MPRENIVTQHCTHGKLVEEIRAGIEKLGKSITEVKVEDLGPVDEFHIGGRVATESFLSQLGITKEHHILDVGCGLGGSSRWAAQEYGCRITGIDLTVSASKDLQLCAAEKESQNATPEGAAQVFTQNGMSSPTGGRKSIGSSN